MIERFLRLLIPATVLLAPGADARNTSASTLKIQGAWTRPTPPGAPAAGGYMRIVNRGRTADRLVAASSPAVARVEIHEMSFAGGIMRMRPLPRGLEVPAGGSAELAPGGYHLMLIGLGRPFRTGGTVPVTLRFATAGEVRTQLDVRTSPPQRGMP